MQAKDGPLLLLVEDYHNLIPADDSKAGGEYRRRSSFRISDERSTALLILLSLTSAGLL